MYFDSKSLDIYKMSFLNIKKIFIAFAWNCKIAINFLLNILLTQKYGCSINI